MRNRLLLPFCAAAMIGISLPDKGNAQESDSGISTDSSRFIRLAEKDGQATALQTSIVRYKLDGKQPTTVDLIGAVHIGEASYYNTLNSLFKDYDVVLYELVAPEGTRVPQGGGGGSGNPISFLQGSFKKFLGLESQLERIDYTPENFRHADMSPDDLRQKMKERGESPWSLAMGAFNEMMSDPQVNQRLQAQSQGLTFSDMTQMLSDPLKAKQFMARQMGAMGDMESGLGSKLSQLIVDDRNEAAMKVFDDVVEEKHKKIAIFYGAAHMPDFEERLEKRKFQRETESWVTAWDLTQSHATKSTDKTMSLLMQLMKELDN